MKIDVRDIKTGYKLRSFDAEENKWYLTEVVKVTDERITLKDIDIKSDFEGMIWEATWEDIEDVEQFKTL